MNITNEDVNNRSGGGGKGGRQPFFASEDAVITLLWPFLIAFDEMLEEWLKAPSSIILTSSVILLYFISIEFDFLIFCFVIIILTRII